MTRRGLTLLEALAAAVLLTVLATAALPVLRGAMTALNQPEPTFELSELSQFADAFLAELGETDVATDSITTEVPWPEAPDCPLVRVHWHAGPKGTGRVWVTFTCAPWTVSRFVAIDTTSQAGPDSNGPQPDGAGP